MPRVNTGRHGTPSRTDRTGVAAPPPRGQQQQSRPAAPDARVGRTDVRALPASRNVLGFDASGTSAGADLAIAIRCKAVVSRQLRRLLAGVASGIGEADMEVAFVRARQIGS